jgi:acyl-CoA thioester hydrolase
MAFAIAVRIYYQDTDAAGVVFHSTYLNFMERARVEWLRSQGFEPRELARRFRLVFIVRHLDIAYIKPAVLDDLVAVTASVQKLGRAQVTLVQEVTRGKEALVRASVNLACVATGSLQPMSVPDEVRASFAEEVLLPVEATIDTGNPAGAAAVFKSLDQQT